MKILVTGGSGTVGKYLVRDLLQHGYETGILDLNEPALSEARFHRADILDLDAVSRHMKGYDAVVHCAGIPHPLNDPPKRVFDVNVNGTFNVMEAAARNGIGKVIFTSSESTLGFAFMTQRMAPEFIPIDESHPTRPQDPYGLSKVVCEEICKSYAARHPMKIIALRMPWIWVPEEAMIPFYRTLVDEYDKWWKNLWTYVHVYDVAQAHRLAVEADLPDPFEAFFITAAENWTGKDSRELLHAHFPETSRIAEGFSGASAIISHEKAAQKLGYHPRHSHHELFRA